MDKLLLVSTILVITTSCCDLGIGDCKKELAGCTDPMSFNYDPAATMNNNSCKSMIGCLGYSSGFQNSGNLTQSFGSAFYDQKMYEEVLIQQDFFNCCPSIVYVLNEGSLEFKNAYANEATREIYFGYFMFNYTVGTYGELAAAGILAHEWGHITQYYKGWKNGTKPEHVELEADAFSGYYMALRKQFAWSQIQGYYSNVYASGDYNFNHPLHHGTPEERIASAYLGVTKALEVLNSGIPYSYQDLHTIFSNEIKTNIAPRPGRTATYGEVCYPTNLTEEYIKSLYPF